jgi:hypothetical protein
MKARNGTWEPRGSEPAGNLAATMPKPGQSWQSAAAPERGTRATAGRALF